MQQSREILKRYWGYDAFRPMQEEIVDAVIYGRDVLALLPTGGGKSVCFQVPGMAREGLCLVVSPLIALMQDQVGQLQKVGIRARAITSGMSYKEIDITLDNARFGGLDFLYISPERLQTRLFIERFKLMNIALIVVDEAHCISEWGHDFRPPYRKIAELRTYHPEVPFIALTATATERVKEDIIEQLKLKNPERFEADFSRPNISYEVYPVENKLKAISKTLDNFQGLTGIIYCQKRKSVKELAQYLVNNGYKVGIYHGGLDKESREQMMQAWLRDQFRIMIATNAFGMGIDKPDVRFVIHYEFPNNPEAYFQEAGRAGRDGLESRTFIYYEQKDLAEMDELIAGLFPPVDVVKNTYRAMCNHLKIAIGSGDGESYPLNIKTFCTQFRLDILETYKALKILEMNGDLLFSESFFHPTKVKFNVGNAALYGFQVNHEQTTALTTLLARSYPGIFDQYCELSETEFCKRLKINAKELERQLLYLEKSGILDIDWKTDLPIVTLLHERLPDDYLQLSPEVYRHRREIAEERWKAMRHFLTRPVCRAQALIAYFGRQVPVCGKCDTCRQEQKANYTFQELVEIIEKTLENPLTLDEIKKALPFLKQQELLKTVQWLVLEERIKSDGKRYYL
ncbi:MAG: ATP-dependent helicase, RecQ family [Crocinitomicaceae bacterium]|jgi:ATP-dependent DNA helicase RecQ|nr:ATP-dependent helicase, RecQ family [Crocinitomicaceae bacterium]